MRDIAVISKKCRMRLFCVFIFVLGLTFGVWIENILLIRAHFNVSLPRAAEVVARMNFGLDDGFVFPASNEMAMAQHETKNHERNR